MLKLMIGVKGTGKTKTLIENVNNAATASHGDVVCIEKGTQLRFDIKSKVRLVDTEEYLIRDAEALYGFVAGILASNYDVTDVFVDNTLKICGGDVAAMEKMLDKVAELLSKHETNVFMTASMPVEEATDTIKKYL
ncbi:MAG: hypothetical protein J6L87_05955 [Clostridia bacterium]|nr:hypothetical protein [Clostridia bacterium]MBQ8339031.1 hypothetical protein [Clostridia bacterium]